MRVLLSSTDVDAVSMALKSAGYAIVQTDGDERALMATAHMLGRLVGAQSFGYVSLQAKGSCGWLGRHTESLTDGSTPLRYFALGCLVPAAEGGATYLYDGSRAARLLAGLLPGADQVRIRYRSAHRPGACHHPLIAGHAQYGQVLRFRSANEYNTVMAKPATLVESDLYATVEEAVRVSLAHVHTWRSGEVLIVDNHRMLHSRAPFAGLRHMLRVRYDDPVHRAVTLGG